MAAGRNIKIGAAWVGIILLILIGWCVIMAAYLTIYGTLESNAVPVSFGSTKVFSSERWDSGYFHAEGSYKDNSAVEDGDELIPQVNDITCIRQSNTCTIATADVYDHFLNLDVTNYDVETWNDKQITFSDDSSICASSSFTIDRASQSFNVMVRKKALIPGYAQNSPLHPCDDQKDQNITLADGFPIYWHLRQRFEQRNSLYFHALLVAVNAAYFGGLYHWWRRRRHRRATSFCGASSLPSGEQRGVEITG
jgi:hypothetical protein